jgi:AbrB family looped-hinge helix DNA binding protein
MKARVDSVGRVVLPKPLREALGLRPGSLVEISRYGAGLQLVPEGRTARIVDEDGVPVVVGDTPIDDETVFNLTESGRR